MESRVILLVGLQALLAVAALYLVYIHLPSFRRSASVTLPDHVSIDDVIRGNWNYDPNPLKYFPTSCLPQNRAVFIKCVQCSTEAVDMVFRRYAYLYNLPVVLPVGKNVYLGWPKPLSVKDFRPSSRGYSMLTEPAIYNNTVMKDLMKPNAVFLTMIRHPLHLFGSVLHSFRMLEAAGRRRNLTPLQTYLRNIEKYEGMFKGQASLPDNTTCIPHGTRNLLSHCLGMPLGYPDDRQNISADLEAVGKYIRTLDSEFWLVMIMEYVDESLILLKRMMCWSFKDILYIGNNSEENKNSDVAISVSAFAQQDRDLHRQWSSADYLLYDHFNRTFWQRVDEHGKDFWEDLAYFRYLQSRVRWFCLKVTPYGTSYFQFPETNVSPSFTVTSEDCRLMESPLLDMLKERYRRQESQFSNSSDSNVTEKPVVC